MKRKRKLFYGRNESNAQFREDPWKDVAGDQSGESKLPDSKSGAGAPGGGKTLQHHPLHVGKARPDEPAIKQPFGAQLGIVPELSFRLILSGPSNSGKTNAARWVIDRYYKDTFDRTILMSPTAKIDPVWKDLKGLKKKDRLTKLSLRPLKRLLREQETKVKSKGKDRAPKILVIFDDTIANHKFINSPEFLQCFIRGRHFNVSIIVMTQSYVKLPRSVRLQGTHVMFFPSFRSEIERLYDDHGPYQLNKREWYTMVMQACRRSEDENWPFFYIDTTKPVEERYRRCLYETIYVDPNRDAPEAKRRRVGKREDEKVEEETVLKEEI
jgi:hypothetical protein